MTETSLSQASALRLHPQRPLVAEARSIATDREADLLSIRYAVPVAYKSGNRHKNRRDDSVGLGHTEKIG